MKKGITLAMAAAILSAIVHHASAADDMDALVAAAKAENDLTIYAAATDNVDRRIVKAFTDKYGIKAAYLRLPSGSLAQRYASEAQAGTFAADVVLVASQPRFLQDGIKNGWLQPIEKSGLPVLKGGNFPSQFIRDGVAVVQVTPWLINYNTDRVKGADIPKNWPDLLNPKFKGQVLLDDPATADSHLDYWVVVADTYGPDFFAKLRALNPRWFVDAVPAMQALAAGEGDIEFATVQFVAQGLIDKGAPIATVTPDPNVGLEMDLALTDSSKAKHPNAAKLFANYLMSPEGGKIFNADPGSYSVFDTKGLPKGYVSPKPGAVSRKAEIRQLLGLTQ
jgi:iron(III) transport system substrate-binding protein